jgi:hypothetical protein|tara:strand:- start:15 stop:938 length:924 start_codon:yes stop_codon:yes gene_type:complete
MAVRQPLYYNSGNLQEMTTTMVGEVVDQIVYQYSLNPSVTLSVVGTGGNLDAITDTRLQAGAASTSTTAFPSEATTAEPSVVTVTYDKLSSTNASVTPTSDTGKTWPVYYTSSGNIQAMSLQDVKDTFLHPTIDLLQSGSTGTQQAGTYHITTSSSGAVSATAIFANTQANTSLYTAGGIGEALDQPTTLTSFYLHQIAGSDTSYTLPMTIDASNNLQVYPEATFESLMQEWIRYTAVSSTDGYSLSYNIGTTGSGNTRGTGMADTRLNGSGNYQTRFVNADDYRAQEFPNGTATTINTYYLRINKS